MNLPASPVYLLDANVLLRLAQSSHLQHATARSALHALRTDGAQLVTAPQSLNEFWAVATRTSSERGGLGMPAAGALAYLNLFERHFPMLPEIPIHAEWKRLILAYGVIGLNAHDARLAAFALAHGVTHLLTFNTKDFNRYAPEGITVVDPATVT